MFSATSHHISMDQQLNQKQTELFDASFKHRFDVEKPIEMSGHFEARPGGRVSDLSSAQISTGRVSDDESKNRSSMPRSFYYSVQGGHRQSLAIARLELAERYPDVHRPS